MQSGQQRQTQIYDIAPTALYLLRLPIPAKMDGQVLTAAVKPGRLEQQPIERGDTTSMGGGFASAEETYSKEEAKAVADRLCELGYL
jgi:hypothetical protein